MLILGDAVAIFPRGLRCPVRAAGVPCAVDDDAIAATGVTGGIVSRIPPLVWSRPMVSVFE